MASLSELSYTYDPELPPQPVTLPDGTVYAPEQAAAPSQTQLSGSTYIPPGAAESPQTASTPPPPAYNITGGGSNTSDYTGTPAPAPAPATGGYATAPAGENASYITPDSPDPNAGYRMFDPSITSQPYQATPAAQRPYTPPPVSQTPGNPMYGRTMQSTPPPVYGTPLNSTSEESNKKWDAYRSGLDSKAGGVAPLSETTSNMLFGDPFSGQTPITSPGGLGINPAASGGGWSGLMSRLQAEEMRKQAPESLATPAPPGYTKGSNNKVYPAISTSDFMSQVDAAVANTPKKVPQTPGYQWGVGKRPHQPSMIYGGPDPDAIGAPINQHTARDDSLMPPYNISTWATPGEEIWHWGDDRSYKSPGQPADGGENFWSTDETSTTKKEPVNFPKMINPNDRIGMSGIDMGEDGQGRNIIKSNVPGNPDYRTDGRYPGSNSSERMSTGLMGNSMNTPWSKTASKLAKNAGGVAIGGPEDVLPKGENPIAAAFIGGHAKEDGSFTQRTLDDSTTGENPSMTKNADGSYSFILQDGSLVPYDKTSLEAFWSGKLPVQGGKGTQTTDPAAAANGDLLAEPATSTAPTTGAVATGTSSGGSGGGSGWKTYGSSGGGGRSSGRSWGSSGGGSGGGRSSGGFDWDNFMGGRFKGMGEDFNPDTDGDGKISAKEARMAKKRRGRKGRMGPGGKMSGGSMPGFPPDMRSYILSQLGESSGMPVGGWPEAQASAPTKKKKKN